MFSGLCLASGLIVLERANKYLHGLKGMPSLYLKCKTCRVKFDSGIVVEERGWEVMKLVDNQHTCPNGHIHTYNKKDYFY